MIHNIGDSITTLFKSIFSSAGRFASSCFAGITSFLAPVQVAIIAATSFILIDVILGYKVSRKYGHKHIESYKLWKTINKVFEATLLIVGAYVIDTRIVTSLNLHAVEFVSGMICGTEFISWLESMKDLHPDCKICKVLEKVLGKVIKAKGEKYLGVDLDIKDFKPNNNDNSNNISS